MARDEGVLLTELFKARICPYCKETIPEGTGVGEGTISRGLFCSLDHYVQYYQLELADRHKQAIEGQSND